MLLFSAHDQEEEAGEDAVRGLHPDGIGGDGPEVEEGPTDFAQARYSRMSPARHPSVNVNSHPQLRQCWTDSRIVSRPRTRRIRDDLELY